MVKFLIFLLIMGALVVLVWHGDLAVLLEKWQTGISKMAPSAIYNSKNTSDKALEQLGSSYLDRVVSGLNVQAKQKIDAWLKDHKINPVVAGAEVYQGKSSASFDLIKYKAILQSYPQILKDVGLTK